MEYAGAMPRTARGPATAALMPADRHFRAGHNAGDEDAGLLVAVARTDGRAMCLGSPKQAPAH